MFMLAIIFTGKGIAALQEAGKIPLDPVALPSIELLGIYPNFQALKFLFNAIEHCCPIGPLQALDQWEQMQS